MRMLEGERRNERHRVVIISRHEKTTKRTKPLCWWVNLRNAKGNCDKALRDWTLLLVSGRSSWSTRKPPVSMPLGCWLMINTKTSRSFTHDDPSKKLIAINIFAVHFQRGHKSSLTHSAESTKCISSSSSSRHATRVLYCRRFQWIDPNPIAMRIGTRKISSAEKENLPKPINTSQLISIFRHQTDGKRFRRKSFRSVTTL